MKKKQILSIQSHSFVDLITNSSSELFVCDTSKIVEMAKEILRELAIIHNQKQKLMGCSDLIDLDKLFTDIFKEPSISEYNFEKIFQLNCALGNDIGFSDIIHFSGDSPLEKEKQEYKQKVWDWEKANPRPKWPGDKASDKENKAYQKKSDIWFAKHRKAETKIWEPFSKVVFNKTTRYDEVCQALSDICRDNGIGPTDLGELHINWQYGHIEIDKTKNSKTIEDFRQALLNNASWGMCPKKGNLIIESVTDNTIPYEMFEDIKQVFSANRHHLG